jgi:hypothetical protein
MLATPRTAMRLHSTFPSTLNLAVEGARTLIALTGPSEVSYPHAVALDHAVDFLSLHFAPGDRGWLSARSIRLQGRCVTLTVTLEQAQRPAARLLPAIIRQGSAWRASASRLACFQSRFSCDLRLDALINGARSETPMGAALRRSALALGAAACAVTACRVDERGEGRGTEPGAALFRAVASLVGMGAGLTPSGDDLLSGFMAASRARGFHALVSALAEAVEAHIAATGEISASLLRCAIEGYWPSHLVELADALAAEDGRAAVCAVDSLCRLGHSSGADIATGFLFGVAVLPRSALQ